MSRYRKNSSAVFSLKYHLVWCPKYRRSVLVGKVKIRLNTLLLEVAKENDWEIHTCEIMPDHVHLFVETDPTASPAGVVNAFKGRTSRLLRQEFTELRTRIPTLWTRSYYAGTVGQVSETTVRKYIEEQTGK